MRSLLFWYLTSVISTFQQNQFIRLLFSVVYKAKFTKRENEANEARNDVVAAVATDVVARHGHRQQDGT